MFTYLLLLVLTPPGKMGCFPLPVVSTHLETVAPTQINRQVPSATFQTDRSNVPTLVTDVQDRTRNLCKARLPEK